MPTPLASRFVHLEIRVDAEDWLVWGAGNGIAPEVLFFVQLEPTLLHQFDPQSKEKAFPSSAGPIVVLHLPCEIGTGDPAQARCGDELHMHHWYHGAHPNPIPQRP